ncbi:hypothetical protein GUITHDRAFT_106083 [Guillardia theta CCMP2712]|uniref:Sfi1 spindle body domain-containing protein n=1 Tax=Guillardia theta (strain CCMP2712) TaxID=905079 RepID=L1JHJ8_GUITC|nr:hypothetical protein GUITHDRAFT_106083 [Guillardia theta CCMP2712]EKX47998.1 hypothetical protein GUITHDRAFT_106083 [Guillardia theta CCMP2712]|eukprot:XP_005834978.1 hypothetical protein GUITHDRAFT_106083 [Guillardia theta CCMP2712]
MDLAAEGMTNVRQKEIERLGARMKDLELERDVAIEEISRLQQEGEELREQVRNLSIAAKSARQEVKEVQENERISNRNHMESIMEISRLQHALKDASDGFERNLQTLRAENDLALQELSENLSSVEAASHRKSFEVHKLKKALLRRQKVMNLRFHLLRWKLKADFRRRKRRYVSMYKIKVLDRMMKQKGFEAFWICWNQIHRIKTISKRFYKLRFVEMWKSANLAAMSFAFHHWAIERMLVRREKLTAKRRQMTCFVKIRDHARRSTGKNRREQKVMETIRYLLTRNFEECFFGWKWILVKQKRVRLFTTSKARKGLVENFSSWKARLLIKVRAKRSAMVFATMKDKLVEQKVLKRWVALCLSRKIFKVLQRGVKSRLKALSSGIINFFPLWRDAVRMRKDLLKRSVVVSTVFSRMSLSFCFSTWTQFHQMTQSLEKVRQIVRKWVKGNMAKLFDMWVEHVQEAKVSNSLHSRSIVFLKKWLNITVKSAFDAWNISTANNIKCRRIICKLTQRKTKSQTRQFYEGWRFLLLVKSRLKKFQLVLSSKLSNSSLRSNFDMWRAETVSSNQQRKRTLRTIFSCTKSILKSHLHAWMRETHRSSHVDLIEAKIKFWQEVQVYQKVWFEMRIHVMGNQSRRREEAKRLKHHQLQHQSLVQTSLHEWLSVRARRSFIVKTISCFFNKLLLSKVHLTFKIWLMRTWQASFIESLLTSSSQSRDQVKLRAWWKLWCRGFKRRKHIEEIVTSRQESHFSILLRSSISGWQAWVESIRLLLNRQLSSVVRAVFVHWRVYAADPTCYPENGESLHGMSGSMPLHAADLYKEFAADLPQLLSSPFTELVQHVNEEVWKVTCRQEQKMSMKTTTDSLNASHQPISLLSKFNESAKDTPMFTSSPHVSAHETRISRVPSSVSRVKSSSSNAPRGSSYFVDLQRKWSQPLRKLKKCLQEGKSVSINKFHVNVDNDMILSYTPVILPPEWLPLGLEEISQTHSDSAISIIRGACVPFISCVLLASSSSYSEFQRLCAKRGIPAISMESCVALRQYLGNEVHRFHSSWTPSTNGAKV